MLYPHFKRFLTSTDLLSEGERIILAVSGGVDSMVMMELFSRIAGSMNLSVCVAHVNHGLRGRDSELDEALVKDSAERMGFAFASVKARPRRGLNLQDSARRLRMAFFRKLSVKFKASKVMLAHNRGDQAETVLMHLIRGAGLAGLTGMSPVSSRDGVIVARPLIFASRKDISAYAKKRGIRFREDRTNRTLKYRRNEIRHKLLPLLAELNPRIEESIAAMAATLAEDEAALELIARASFNETRVRSDKRGVSMRVEDFRAMPRPIRARMLGLAWQRVTGSRADLNRDQIERMDQLSHSSKREGSYKLRSPWEFVRCGELIEIKKSTRPARRHR